MSNSAQLKLGLFNCSHIPRNSIVFLFRNQLEKKYAAVIDELYTSDEYKAKATECVKQNFELLITGNPQIAMILIKLFCKRIYDQKRRIRTLVITDPQARIGDVFLMFDEMNPCPNPNERSRRFNLTIQDVAHWAGLPINQVRDELNKFVEKHKIEIYTNYIIVTNISDMKRFVDSRCQQR